MIAADNFGYHAVTAPAGITATAGAAAGRSYHSPRGEVL